MTPPSTSEQVMLMSGMQQRFSYELEAYQECEITIRCIKACDRPEELHEWSQCIRKKWVLTQRTVDARIKHHKLFYAGGAVSHQAFIDNLTKQKDILEEKLLRIDERAYYVGGIVHSGVYVRV